MILHVEAVKVVGGSRLWLRFTDGAEGVVDLAPALYGDIFAPLRDPALFRQVFLTSRTIEWPNGADFAPEFLRQQLQQTVSVP